MTTCAVWSRQRMVTIDRRAVGAVTPHPFRGLSSLAPCLRRVGAPGVSGANLAGWRPTCRRMGPRSLRWVQLPSCYRHGSLARLPCRLHTRRRRLVNRLGPRELLTPPRPAHISTEPRSGTLSAGLASVLRASMLPAGVPMARAPRKTTLKRTGHTPRGAPLGGRPPQAHGASLLRPLRRASPSCSRKSSRRSSSSRRSRSSWRSSRRCSRLSQRTGSRWHYCRVPR